MMKSTACRALLLFIFAINLTACGTIISLSAQDYTPYAGVLSDFDTIRSGGFLSILAVIDLPLSFVLDTFMLPVTLTR